MEKRIYGLENEYRIIPPALINRGLEQNQNNMVGQFLVNGARLYQDGSHLEYSTPECTSVMDAIAYEKAGTDIVFQLMKDFAKVFKSSHGWETGTCGYHESYLIERRLVLPKNFPINKEADFTQIQNQLLAFLAGRVVLSGTGGIKRMGRNKFEYHISPRATHIYVNVGEGTTQNSHRAMINDRDSPYADKEKYFRLHLILGDANLSDTSLLLKIGTTGLVLRMIEAGALQNIPILKHPVFSLQAISQDPTCRVLVELHDGRLVTALDILEIYYERVILFAETNLLTDEEQFILNKWIDIVSKLRRDPMECYQELDWVIKLFWTQWYQDQTGLPLEHVDVRAFSHYTYHDANPENSIYFDLLRQGKIVRHISDEQIQHARDYSPHNTRAKIRGELINALLSHPAYKDNIYPSWENIQYQLAADSKIYTIHLGNPFETENEKVDWLINHIVNNTDVLAKTTL